MNEQQLVESLYPEPRHLDDSDRARLRSELFGATSALAHRPTVVEHRATDDTHAPEEDQPEFIADTKLDAVAGRRWMNVAAAAVVIAGIAGVWTAAGRNSEETPAPVQQPSTVAPGEPGTRPTAFPVLDELPTGLSATAYVDREGSGRTSPRTQALIGRRVDGVLTDAVALAVQSEPVDITPLQGQMPTEAVVMGQPALVHDESYPGLTVFTITWGSGPYFVAQGEAPLAFLDRADPAAIAATMAADPDDAPQVTINALPDDFEVIVAPHPVTVDASASATLSIGPDNYNVSVSAINPLVGVAMTSAGHPLRSIEINGQPGWTSDSLATTPDIVWQVNETTYAYLSVSGSITAADALTLASEIRFVDFDTWTARYSIDAADLAPTTSPAGN